MGEPLIKKQHDVFQAIADPSRRRMLKLLADKEMPIATISGHFPMSRTAVSKHLRILSEAGLVRERRVGRENRFRLDPEPLREVQQWYAYFDRFWENKMAALQRLVESESELKSDESTE